MNIKYVMISILFFLASFSYGNDKKKWVIEGGTKATFVDEQTSGYFFYNPFANLTSVFDIFEIDIFYSPYIDHKLISGTGEYEYIDIHRTGIGLSLPGEIFEISGEYIYLTGEKDFRGHDLSVDLNIYAGPLTLLGAYNSQFNKFDFNGTIESTVHSYEGGLGYDVSRNLNLEGAFEQTETRYDSIDYTYVQNIFRFSAGYISLLKNKMVKSTILLCGISAGWDSDDYRIFGIDAGAVAKISGAIKLKVHYAFREYRSIVSIPENNSKKSKNPALTELLDSYDTHKLMLGISVYY